ncbi:4-amino-4-deoxy-L-arabinose-phospho-UDP flippase [Acidovorax sp. sic0104]|uniref:4-amino-4-deoxy-L-arabinose-phospho-UDP flippase n=1 Tax=Acidovorax sp. sic0104 TaxID=2854784 RepID=UPI001C474AD2|nr:4-amino-4-deoxy-L-arabinose-phospho-UDP flippase [Acidovorax sp. sic0104]MBV7540328.1 4-amino-4-deoxy-L-arabinose-phospho-UDP flippase [Acidovorax sp. sic0104]
MITTIHLLAILCVLGIAAGQILFKYSALAINQAGSMFAIQPLLYLAATMALYGVTSIGWVLILRHAELGKVYPIMALAFVFVPIASHFLFGERFSPGYFAGATMIAAGIVMIFYTSAS